MLSGATPQAVGPVCLLEKDKTGDLGVFFSLGASAEPHWVDGECCWILADKAKWLKTLPVFGSLSPNPNENRHRGKPGTVEGQDSHPSAVTGTGTG